MTKHIYIKNDCDNLFETIKTGDTFQYNEKIFSPSQAKQIWTATSDSYLNKDGIWAVEVEGAEND